MTDPAFRPATTRPAERYGDRPPSARRRVATAALVAVLGVVAVGWLVWVAVAGSSGQVHAELLGFRRVSASEVEVRFAVDRDPGSDVACVLRARDAGGAEVARRQVLLPPGNPAHVERTEVLRTLRPAVSGELLACRSYERGPGASSAELLP